MLLETIAKMLYFEKLVALNKKSIAKKVITIILPVKTKISRNNTVKKPFNRATVSFIFLLEMGHMAYIFISCFILNLLIQRYSCQQATAIPSKVYFLYHKQGRFKMIAAYIIQVNKAIHIQKKPPKQTDMI